MEEAGDDNTLSVQTTTILQKTHNNTWGVNVPTLGKKHVQELKRKHWKLYYKSSRRKHYYLIQVLRALLIQEI